MQHLATGPTLERFCEEIERFLVSTSGAPVTELELESVLATVLFTDLVGSTAKAAELGNRGWRELLAQHHACIRDQLARHRGSSSTPRATGSSRGLAFEDRGTHELKGIPGEWPLYAAV
jgi:hypothetical protein